MSIIDSWTITDIDDRYHYQVAIITDEFAGRPEKQADVYDAVVMQRAGETGGLTPKEIDRSVQWAKDAVAAWERDEWQFVTLVVTPVLVLGDEKVVLSNAASSLGGVEYGELPDQDPEQNTMNRAYLRTSHLNDMIDEVRSEAEDIRRKIIATG